MSRIWKLTLIVVLLITVIVWLLPFSTTDNLKVITCDVGQGDASLIVYKSTEILIDGGPDNSVLECLSKHLPFWDRTIEVVVLTHPQSDHYTGLIGVFSHYRVEKILANSLEVSNQQNGLLKNQVLGQGSEWVRPVSGMVVRSRTIQLDILYPSEEIFTRNFTPSDSDSSQNANFAEVLEAESTKVDPNDISVVSLVTFGSFKFLFTGDAGSNILDSLASSNVLISKKPINYIKVSHHGSKSALSEKLYALTDLGIAVISVGENSYGHPHQEVSNALSRFGLKVYRTDRVGDIVVETDGKKIWVVKQ